MGLELTRQQALELWHGVTVHTVRDDAPDMTARQLAVLMTVQASPGPHTVRGLAATLKVGKPAITRALDTLTRHGLVRRRRDHDDGRNVLVNCTSEGHAYVAGLADVIARRAADLGLTGLGPKAA